MEITYTATSTLEPSLIADLMTTVIEGGSNYWCDRIILVSTHNINGVVKSPWYASPGLYSDGSPLILEVSFEEGQKPVTLTLASLAEGFRLCALNYPRTFQDILIEDFDAGDADTWFQLSCFKEIVYG